MPMAWWRWSGLWVVVCGLLTTSAARAEAVLRYDFREGVADWRTTFPGAALQAAPERPASRIGPPSLRSLEFSYTPNSSASPAFFTLPPSPAPRANSVRFWIRCNEPTPLQLAVGEKDGSGFYYSFNCPAGQWVRVSIPLADLNLIPSSTD